MRIFISINVLGNILNTIKSDQFSNALNLTLKVKYTWAEYAAQPTIESKHLGWDFQPLSRRL